MAIKKEFVAILLIGVAACACAKQTEYCPPLEVDVPHCSCNYEDESYQGNRNIFDFYCSSCNDLQTYREILLKNNHTFTRFNAKLQLKFNKCVETNLTSRGFADLRIQSIEIKDTPVQMFADKIGGPAFQGLEDVLETLIINNRDIYAYIDSSEMKDITHWRLGYETEIPMTVGDLRTLRYIRIIGDKIRVLTDKFFGNGGKNVGEVELASNEIEVLGDHVFSSLSKLREINLRENKLNSLKRSIFPNPAEQLESIDVGSNEISTLPDDMFINMPALQRVEINHNKINVLREAVWKPVWSTFRWVSISDLNCEDENIAWMFKLEFSDRLLSLTCSHPPERKDKKLYDVAKEFRNQSYRK